ncbi:hypothetical protein LDENG_00131740 [Lucifuga dentata]|nr:hypothetical protein LDENG_00131740 [Lucifuga dentata]
MGRICAVISCVLLTVGAATAQTAQQQNERLLPQWLTGIIAVTVFLFLAFVAFLVNKAWCANSRSPAVESEKDGAYGMTSNNATSNDAKTSSLDVVRSRENKNAFENLVIDSTDEVTSM